MRPITEIAEILGIPAEALIPYGQYKAKVRLSPFKTPRTNRNCKLILVTATTPTKFGEGKTTTAIALADALNRLNKKAAVCLREPSLGPCFGLKGGATGGGKAQVVPTDEINLHFTGDFHAVGAANNLLAAMLDNHIYWGNKLQIKSTSLARSLDINDRALRNLLHPDLALAGSPKHSSFSLTVASEVMAILCLLTSKQPWQELEERLARMIIGISQDGTPIRCSDLKAQGAMAALLKDAVHPNLAQTLEGSPAFIHGGPFANIAHGCNSILATKMALEHCDFAVTEAGFGSDLGAEKFFHIKCRSAGLEPSASVLVTSVRSLKEIGKNRQERSPAGLWGGAFNLKKHIENLQLFGMPVLVAINRFPDDKPEDLALVKDFCEAQKVPAWPCTHFQEGGAGILALASALLEQTQSAETPLRFLYAAEDSFEKKLEAVAKKIYGAQGVAIESAAKADLQRYQDWGAAHFPVCIAKTPYSFSADAGFSGDSFDLPVRKVQLAAGAGFLVAYCGEISSMPGLPRVPNAESIGLDAEGNIKGLF